MGDPLAGTTKPLAASFRVRAPAQRYRRAGQAPSHTGILFEEPAGSPKLQDVAPTTAKAVIGAICFVTD